MSTHDLVKVSSGEKEKRPVGRPKKISLNP